jgi:hypothetical protein
MQKSVLSFVFLFLIFSAASISQTQNQPVSGSAPTLTADYPENQAGVLLEGDPWKALANQMPAKVKTAHGFAASLSYGVVPAKVVAEYDGEHAPTRVEKADPVFCVCHFQSLPGEPALVRLHAKKNARELDGGRMIVYPVVGGAKMADASKSDILPVQVSHPNPQVWLIRATVPLEPGEYALMLGTQNMSIFPFTVVR